MHQASEAPTGVVAARLLDARKAAGLTQQEAAEQLGVSRPTLIAIEKGTRQTKPEELIKLAALYGRTLNELVRPGPAPQPIEPHLRASLSADTSPDLLGAIGELTAFADDYRALEQLTGTLPFRQFPPEVTVPQRVEVAAFAEDVAIRERSRLHLGDQPVYELRSLVEQSGVHVFYGGLPSRLAGLYAFVPDLGYCILINRKHPPERRRWTLAHEYAYFLADRHKPGVDTVQAPKRKPLSERFADAFAASFLMPETAMRRHFLAVTERTGDFQTADLSRLAHHFYVSVQAAALRLEDVGLLSRGTWDALIERGFKPGAARRLLGLPARAPSEDSFPERYRYLAVQAYIQEAISEGQLARFLRTDRVTAREIVEATLTSRDLDAEGHEQSVQMPEQLSLFDLAS
jgi:Zn-dependent peptidase ImmA (M78 family)/transcriptional regulator with XRE-family HTH domain